MRVNQIVVIGASAGGVEALRRLVADLPTGFVAPVCVVLHMSPDSPGVLADMLDRVGPMPASTARNGERLRPGVLHVAPPDHHLIVEPGVVRLTKGPKENRFRPAIDPLFRSAAQVYGPAAIGVILTGNLDDGTAGLWAIKQLGGIAIVQDPDDAMFPGMPRSAIDHVDVDYVVRLCDLGPLLHDLVGTPVAARPAGAPEHLEVEMRIARDENAIDAGIEQVGRPSSYACPECHGVLLELKEDGRVRFRCRTGHAYSVNSLVAAVNEGIEETTWNAIRSLEENGLLLRDLSEEMKTLHRDGDASRIAEAAETARRRAEILRETLSTPEPLTTPEP